MSLLSAIRWLLGIDSKNDGRRGGQTATVQSHGRIHQYVPGVVTKPLNRIASAHSDSDETMMIGSSGTSTTSQTVNNDGSSNKHYTTKTKHPDPRFVATMEDMIPNMNNLALVGMDREGRKSFCSDVENKFQKYVWLEDYDGKCFKVLVQFDTGASSNLITRGTLEKLGRHKEKDIPDKYKCTYQSPVDLEATTKPTNCVYVKMANEELAFYDDDVKLKIIEMPSVFQIIIGRNLIKKHSSKVSLLLRLEQSQNDIMNDDTSPRIICPVFKVHRTTHQKRSDTARDVMNQNATNQSFRERQEALQSPPYSPADATTAGPDRWNGPWTAPQYASTDWRTPQAAAPPSHPYYYSHTTNIGYAGTPGNGPQMGVNRTDTGDSTSTQSTQHTQYSMGRQSIASSRTSYSDCTGTWHAGKATEPQPPVSEPTQYGGQEDSARRM